MTTGVHLREITADTVRAVTKLDVHPEQRRFVASNAVSLAQALFAPEAWYRAIHDGEALAGFVMLYDETLRAEPPAEPQVGVWRLMIDAAQQRRGIGRQALGLVIDHVRAKRRFRVLKISYVPGDGCPEPLYTSVGFRPTGELDEGEVVMALDLSPED